MCLSIPAEIISISDNTATVSVGGTTYEACMDLIEDAKVGDYVLLHTGFALQIIDPEEAREALQRLEELKREGGKGEIH